MGDLHFEKTSPIGAPAGELFAWHARPGAFRRLVPPWQNISLPEGDPEVREGARATIRMRRGPLALSWIAEHRNVRPGRGFEDVQIEGPFAKWHHRHEFLERGDRSSLLRDSIDFRLPGGAAAAAVLGGAVSTDIQRAFDYRHRTTAADLELHERFAGWPRLSVAITGASGLIGESLAALLTTGGHRVLRLVRAGGRTEERVGWSPERGVLEPSRLEGIDAVVHLAGESIAGGRWTPDRRRRIRDSRVLGTRRLVQSLETLERPPATFVSASAIGFYGDRGTDRLDESGARGSGFLAEVCEEWEAEARAAGAWGARAVQLRFGVVVSPSGGFLPRLLPPFKAGFGGPVGNGEQYVSWISLDDAIAAVLFVLMTGALEGAVNVAAPNPATSAELARILGRVLRRPAVVPLPAAVARLAFGSMADEMLLASTRVVPDRLLACGFTFRHRQLEEALRHLLGR